MFVDRSIQEQRMDASADFQIGDLVRIKKGILKGVEAIVTKVAAGPKFILAVDRWPEGVLVSLDSASIVPAAEEPSAAS